jgi:hypothetical protein
MMLFEYKCKNCGAREEREYGPGDGQDGGECSECGGEMGTVRQ